MSEHMGRLKEFVVGLIIFEPVKQRRYFLKYLNKIPDNWYSVEVVSLKCKADRAEYVVEDIVNKGYAIERGHGPIHQIKITAEGILYIKTPEAFLEELTIVRLTLKALHLYSLLHWD